MTGERQASVPSFKGRNRDSALENRHREKKALENATPHFQVQ